MSYNPLAHFQAATKPKLKLLHRDISGGNILIVPSILEDDNGAEIQWKGILTDWEMSKPQDCPAPRQPERTVSGSETLMSSVY